MKMNKLPLRRKLVFKSIKNMCRILLKKARCGSIGLFWLGWRDSNPRDAGVKVLGWGVGFEPTVFRATI